MRRRMSPNSLKNLTGRESYYSQPMSPHTLKLPTPIAELLKSKQIDAAWVRSAIFEKLDREPTIDLSDEIKQLLQNWKESQQEA